MGVRFDKDSLDHLASAIRSQQAALDGQVKSLLAAAQRDPSGWDGASAVRYDDELHKWAGAQGQLDEAMQAMAKVIDNISAALDDLNSRAMQ
ncbi:WXG100 family type VII secretion target [Frankineae bacterium MT45]|nr:WXG100 family type VII secretion target [Frankineae bacterium MT45]